MRKTIKSHIETAIALLVAFMLGGCATLAVTPPLAPKETTARQPVTVGIQATGERLRAALSDPAESAATAASGKLFDKVVLLPPETRFKQPAEIRASYGTDYILSTTISDVSVNGKLNPIWFASIPLFFFKPYAPIVTFEATVTLDNTVRDARTGDVVLQREETEVSTDHFSPIDPQEKVRKLIGRSINNAVVVVLGEIQEKAAARQVTR